MRRSIPRFRQLEHRRPAAWDPGLGSPADSQAEAGAEEPSRRASDVEEVRRLLADFSEDELGEIPVLAGGTPLHEGKTYLDLKDPRRRPFTPTGEIRAQAGHWYVAKDQAPPPHWNRLIGLRELKSPT